MCELGSGEKLASDRCRRNEKSRPKPGEFEPTTRLVAQSLMTRGGRSRDGALVQRLLGSIELQAQPSGELRRHLLRAQPLRLRADLLEVRGVDADPIGPES